MDYDLARQKIGSADYDFGYQGDMGTMPNALLTQKFEETDMGDEEDMYDDFARSQLTNWGPDQNQFEHEGSRGGVNRRSGRLQFQYYGHRGEADVERPELFLGFGGPEDHDPRGIASGPDMKKLTEQEWSRMRFKRFSSDMSDHIGSGNRSEAKVMRDQQSVFKFTKDRLKIFSRQIDGRREGLRRSYKNESNATKQVFVQSYGEYIKDYALNPQRRPNIIIGQLIRDSREWRDHTNDQDFAIVKYLDIARKSRKTMRDVRGKEDIDIRFTDADSSMCFRTAGLLMSQIVRSKKTKMNGGDADFTTGQDTRTAKTAPVVKDLGLILRAIENNTAAFGVSRDTSFGKNATPQMSKHLAQVVAYNHLIPSHYYLNAELIYKHAKNGDIRKARDKIITDNKVAIPAEKVAKRGKTAKRKMLLNTMLAHTEDRDKTESLKYMNYKLYKSTNGDRRIRLYSADGYTTESHNTKLFKTDQTKIKIADKNDQLTGIGFSDNQSKERMGGHFGSKYTNNLIMRDSADSSIMQES